MSILCLLCSVSIYLVAVLLYFSLFVLFSTPRRLPQVLGLAEVTATPTPWPVAGLPSHKIPSFAQMIAAYRQGSPLKRVYYHTGRRSGFVR